ncbi:MAG TPA: triphosphoribosyl-dephospho-CoA synthase [Gemmatales bacterium]|nr:triphosphoribosyl-dephospho-CoA synthase [Gemmatales bacterium]
MLLRHTNQELVELACLWEASVHKPGNVHPGAAFVDTNYNDFELSAGAIAPVFAGADVLSVGQLVLQAVQATRQAVGKNTNLGIILALAPLAKASDESAIAGILQQLTIADAADVYEAIRLARPGGLGKATSQDIREQPTVTLLEAMRLAADRDLIARQYVSSYHDVQVLLLPRLIEELNKRLPDHSWRSLDWWLTTLQKKNSFWSQSALAIQATFLHGLVTLGDTLIARKCGIAVMQEAQQRAAQVLASGWPETQTGLKAYGDFDTWLRADGHRRNPGTMADLIAATLFLLLRRVALSREGEAPADLSYDR